MNPSTSCQLQNSSFTAAPSPSKQSFRKLFSWNREKPRQNSEYVDKKFSKQFNNIAQELKVIGGLGKMKTCVNKKTQRQILVNRPTQVQKISHTTTKVLSNFNLTEDLKKPLACGSKKKLSIHEHVDEVKFAENSPKIETIKRAKANKFNHENPFNLDFNALNEYQKQKTNAEEVVRKRNFQIIRRTMETMKLKTEGAEEIKQEERDEKFKLPAFFNIDECCDDAESAIMKKIDEDKTAPSSSSSESNELCTSVSMVDKSKNKKMIKLHYEHKREKLRWRLRCEKERNEKLLKEIESNKKDEEENFIFRLADESFPSSEYNDNDSKVAVEPETVKFDYFANEVKLSAENDDFCGQKVGTGVILRSFHDRHYTEPRGRSNLHLIQDSTNGNCLTQKEWFHKISNDPKILSVPPKGKLLSSLKPTCNPNDDKTLLFYDDNDNRNERIQTSAIKHHIRQIDLKMKQRICKSKNVKKSRIIDENEHQKRYQRMKFMGIPTTMRAKKSQANVIETIVRKISENSYDDKLTSKDKNLNAKMLPQDEKDIKLMPKIPTFADESNFSSDVEDECEQSKAISTFTRAKPRGNNPEMLRIDKSLPWIQSDINATKVKLKNDAESCNTPRDNVLTHVQCDKKMKRNEKDENQSEIKKFYNNIIDTKLQYYYCNSTNELRNDDEIDSENENEMQSASSLSSNGTYFTNDSGSYITLFCKNEKIPKSRLNIEKKFQNRSLVKIKLKKSLEANPYYNDNLAIMRQLCKPPDRFHTQRTRSCANLRERVKVESVNYEDEIIEKSKFKLATDIDESYIKEFYHERSRTEFRFKRVSDMVKLREILRRKFEIYYHKERAILNQIEAESDAKVVDDVKNAITEYENFLVKLKETTYRNTSQTMQTVESHYQKTDELRAKHNQLYVQIEPLRMKIFYIAIDFVRLVKYQNFQYLLMPLEWRLKYDHLHRNPVDGILEDFRTSIENRDVKNLWDKNNVTIDTIMNFINDVYCSSTHKMLSAFDNGIDLLKAYKDLEAKSFKALAKLTYAGMNYAKIQNEIANAVKMNEVLTTNYENATRSIRNRWQFIENRTQDLRNRVKIITNQPLHASFTSPLLNQLNSICDILFKKILCENGSEDVQHIKTTEKFALIEDKVLKIFKQFDELPRDTIIEIENNVRMYRKRKLRVAERARKIELNIEQTMLQIQRSLSQPKRKAKREGRLPISVLPKKAIKLIKEVSVLSPLEEEYMRAFTELSGENIENVKFDNNVKRMIEKIRNESTPLYLDKLLESLEIKIKTLNDKDIEEILKDEEAHLKFKDVLPNARKQVQFWETLREEIKNANIKKTLYLYEKK